MGSSSDNDSEKVEQSRNVKLKSKSKQSKDSSVDGKFYFIDVKLKEQLTSEKQKSGGVSAGTFSLLKVFGDGNEKSNRSVKNVKHKFNNYEEEIDEPRNIKVDDFSHYQDHSNYYDNEDIKWWCRDNPLFFKKDDRRFKVALDFLRGRDEDYVKNFTSVRKEIKTVIKHKVKKIQLNIAKEEKQMSHSSNRKKFKKFRKNRRR